MRSDKGRNSRRAQAQNLWRLCEVGTTSRIVRSKIEARTYIGVIEVVVKVADMTQAI
jgi:hypothetical protein